MFQFLEKAVLGMALLRIISGCIEITAAFLMMKFNTVDKALMINSSLAIIGPLILITTTTIGVIGLADNISLMKLIWIFLGVCLILIGIKS
ncbi:YqhV family protein [Bacillus sp. BRMEA1]|uniref:YqhV family protein n=1 Tax=Neobacillus endophyticus TaxID=2738405 RepID=UPI001565630E|nr:YqhV family protein [Neobacillus endophyticus]NRD79214.1 YqhV family protein [Neobacillus endophyticus]